MRQVTLDELGQLAANARVAIWDKAQQCGREPKIYLHWTAGWYDSKFDDYHLNIDGEGRFYVSTDNFADTLNHTWKRNTGAIGIALCCCANANTNNLGSAPPTTKQIEAMAQVIAKIAAALWLTIDKAHVLTHGEAADNEDGEYIHEPYGPLNGCERWDLEYLGTSESPRYNPRATDGTRGGDVLRGKANWYASQNMAKTSQAASPQPVADLTTNAVATSQNGAVTSQTPGMLSEHFSASEFVCHCGCGQGGDKMSPRLIDLLEQLRYNIGGIPLRINSGYRCPAHNANVGGVKNSQHTQGTAADVARPAGLTYGQFKWYAAQLDFDAIGLYPSSDFLHLDVRYGGQGGGDERFFDGE